MQAPTQGELVKDSPTEVVNEPEQPQTVMAPTTLTTSATVEGHTDAARTATKTAEAVRDVTPVGSRVRRSARSTQNQAPLRFKDYVV